MPRARSPDLRLGGTRIETVEAALSRAVIAVLALLAPLNAAQAADAGALALTQPPPDSPPQAASTLPAPAFAAATPPAPASADQRKQIVAALNASPARLEPKREDALITKVEAVTMFAAQCGLALPSQGRAGATGCPFDDSDLGVKLNSQFGQTKAYASFAFGTASPWTPQRQLSTYRPGMLEQNSAALFGVSQGLFDSRLRLTTELAWTDSRERALFEAPLLRRSDREQGGASTMVRAEATLLDSPRRRWTLKAEYSAVSDEFAMRQTMVLGQAVAMPGKRLALSSTLKLGRTRFVASFDDYRSSFGNGVTRRLGVTAHGVSLTLRSKSFAFQPSGQFAGFAQFALPTSRSGQTAASLDFDMTELSPGVAKPFKLLGPLAPQSLSLGWRSGWSETAYAGNSERYRRSGWNVAASWETPIGETSFDYTRDRRIGVAPLAVTKTSQSYQLSHMIRTGGWRLGADVMLSQDSATGARGFRDKSLSFGQTLAYSRTNGPEFRLRIGQDQGRTRYNSDFYASRSNGLNVTATLDLTRYLRKRFERDDLRLKLEFRKRMDSTDETYALLEDIFERSFERTDRSVFLLSFGMKL